MMNPAERIVRAVDLWPGTVAEVAAAMGTRRRKIAHWLDLGRKGVSSTRLNPPTEGDAVAVEGAVRRLLEERLAKCAAWESDVATKKSVAR